jgi:hypothetical protein
VCICVVVVAAAAAAAAAAADDDAVSPCDGLILLTFWRRNFFFLNLAHLVYKM